MNKVRKVLSCIVFMILLIAAFYCTARLLESKTARMKYTDFYETDTEYDVIFMGTSHMYNSVLPMELWEEYGITSYNWGYSNCTLAENYYILQDVVKNCSAKLVVIDLYGITEYEAYNNGKYRTDRIEQQHVQFDSLKFSRNKIDAVLDIFDDYDDNEDFLFDFIMYHTRWEDLTESDFNIQYSSQKGASYLLGHAEASFEALDTDEIEIDSVCSEYVPLIIDFCNENNIELLFTYLPGIIGYNSQAAANSIDAFLEDFGECSFYNMLYDNQLNYTIDFYSDASHLNYMIRATKGSYL